MVRRWARKGAMMIADEAVLLNVRQVAGMTGLGQRTVWKLSAAGRMPRPVRIGRAVRWRRDDLIDWIENECHLVERDRAAARKLKVVKE